MFCKTINIFTLLKYLANYSFLTMMPNMKELEYQFHLIQAIRNFFLSEKFTDVLTPPMVSNPGMETHIHPFSVYSAHGDKKTGQYLHTSPEFHMKKLLAEGLEKIFTISYCFRDEPDSPIHRNQFLMLEWYRANERYEKIMDDCEDLFKYTLAYLQDKKATPCKKIDQIKFERLTIQDLFQEYCQVDILQFLEKKELANLIQKDFKDVPLPETSTDDLSWDDLYFLLFLNKIESRLEDRDFLILSEYPHHLSTLSTIKKEDPRVCERFELYVRGIELANCFNELTDLSIQKKRFEQQKEEKLKLYNYQLPEADMLYQALDNGFPASAGIALGVERLLKSLIQIDRIFF